MRLAAIRRGNRWPNRLFLWLVATATRLDPPDVVRTLTYRSGFFGGPFSAVLQPLMRGRSTWTPISAQLKAALGLVGKLTLSPEAVGYRQAAQVLLRFGYKLPAPRRLLARNPTW